MKKTKTLIIILNHNLPEYTDRLYLDLKNNYKHNYDLIVMDNGSEQQFKSKFTNYTIKQNVYWGGALNKAFELVLQNNDYDSLLFLNNDIELTSEIFVEALRYELFHYNYAIVSPCIAGAPRPWRQMQNWGSKGTREVKWIDNQAPLFHRKLIEAIGKFDESLYYGWGQELICYEVCNENNWKIGVCDHIAILHYAKETILQNRLISSFEAAVPNNDKKIIGWNEFEGMARDSYEKYFVENPLKYGTFNGLREYGEKYSYKPDYLNYNSSLKSRIRNTYLRIVNYIKHMRINNM